MFKAKRLQKIQGTVFKQVAAKKRQLQASGRQIIDLSIGSPDLPPAPHIVHHLQTELAKPNNYGYTIQASDEFRDAVAQWYGRRFGVTVNPPQEVAGLLGSQEGLAHICLALLDPGDVVLVPDPAYPIYHAGPILAGATVFPLPLTAENNFVPRLDQISYEVAAKAKMIILNFPANPVASTVNKDFFTELVAFAKKNHIVVLHDAAYSELAFDGFRPPSFLEAAGAKEVGVEFNSLSKAFNMAGCRIAYAVGNPEIVQALEEISGHTGYGPFNPVQQGAIAALSGPQECVKETAAVYQRRRDILVAGLNSIGWPVQAPKATMFLWAKVPREQHDQEFTMQLMEQSGVAVVPGSGFGQHGQGFVRIALVQEESLLEQAVAQIADSGLLK